MGNFTEGLEYLGPEVTVPHLSVWAELADAAREYRFLIAGLAGLAGSVIPDSVMAGGLLQEGVELPGWLTKEMIDYLISGLAGGLVCGLLSAGWEKLLGKPMVLGVDQQSGRITNGAIVPANTKEVIGNGVEGMVPGFALGILFRVVSENPISLGLGIAAWWLFSKTYQLPIDTSSMKMPNGRSLSVGQFFKVYLGTRGASRVALVGESADEAAD